MIGRRKCYRDIRHCSVNVSLCVISMYYSVEVVSDFKMDDMLRTKFMKQSGLIFIFNSSSISNNLTVTYEWALFS